MFTNAMNALYQFSRLHVYGCNLACLLHHGCIKIKTAMYAIVGKDN